MSYTLLQLIDQACGEMGLAQPASVIGSTANQTVQLLALVQRLGRDLVREFEWNRLTKTYVFQTDAGITTTGNTTSGSTTVSSIPAPDLPTIGYVISGTGIPSYAECTAFPGSNSISLDMPATATGTGVALRFLRQDYTLPNGFDRMVSDTNYDRSLVWKSSGNESSQTWSVLHTGLASTYPPTKFRIYNNRLRLFPAPTTIRNLSYEYVSNYCVNDSNLNPKALFTLDSDTSVFPDDLMLAGLKFYFLRAKKLDFGAEFADFRDTLSARKAQDQPQTKQRLTPETWDILSPSIPDGSWSL